MTGCWVAGCLVAGFLCWWAWLKYRAPYWRAVGAYIFDRTGTVPKPEEERQ